MSANRILVDEVAVVVNGRLDRGEKVHVPWLKQELLQRHTEIEGADKDFYLVCASDALEVAIKEFLSRVEREEKADGLDPLDDRRSPQLAFPGFPKLQRGYLVIREGERLMVPLERMTDEEIEQKAQQYDAMAVGCREHARQLRRYLDERTVEATQ